MRPTKPPTKAVPVPEPEMLMLPMAYEFEIVARDAASPTKPPKKRLLAVTPVLEMSLVTEPLVMSTELA